MGVKDRRMYERAFRERRWKWLENALRAAQLRWEWEGGAREKEATIRYIQRLLSFRPPYNPHRPNHWYWRQDG